VTSRAEHRIHVVLMLALGAANLAILVRGPFEGPLPVAEAARRALAEPLVEASRPEIEAGIQRLKSWLTDAQEQAGGGPEQALALQGLGPPPDDRAHPERWLARSLGRETTTAWLVPAPDRPAPGADDLRRFAAALVILLESGTPLEQQIEGVAGEKAGGLTLSDLVRRALDAFESPLEGLKPPDDPDRLDLLSFAVLGGLSEYRERLALAAQGTLRRLTLARRDQPVPIGAGLLQREQLLELARAWHDAGGSEPPGAAELHASAALFRAAAVLQDPGLDALARPHLGALIAGYRNDRTLYLYLEASARDSQARQRVRMQALENLGRFEELVYNAHLAFRGAAEAAPAPDTARAMRVAARDLLERLAVLDAAPPAKDQRRQLLRAAVHALRGLRTARLSAS
jgi:hypothetical protein